MSQPIDQVSLKAAFVSAAYYKIHPALIGYTAEFRGGKLFAQIVVLDTAAEEEIDDTMDILGGIVGAFDSLTADFRIIEAASLQEAESVSPLQIQLFHRALRSRGE